MTKEKVRSILGKNIISRRIALGWDQLDLAEKSNLSIGVIRKLELGPKEGSPEARQAIANALNCSISDLYREPSKEKLSIIDIANKLDAIRSLPHIDALLSAWRSPEVDEFRLIALLVLTLDQRYLEQMAPENQGMARTFLRLLKNYRELAKPFPKPK